MKDVVSCDKPRKAAHKHYIRGFPNGATLYIPRKREANLLN